MIETLTLRQRRSGELLDIVIETTDGRESARVAKLHTNSESNVNAIDPQLVSAMGGIPEKLEAGDPAATEHNLQIEGEAVSFVGSVELQWRPYKENKRIKTPIRTRFYVPDGEHTPFEAVLSRDESTSLGLRKEKPQRWKKLFRV